MKPEDSLSAVTANNVNLFKQILDATKEMTETYVRALQAILDLFNAPTIDPDNPIPLDGPIYPSPIDPDKPIDEQPIPTPTPVNPPVEVMSTKPEPVQDEPKYTMEDVRKALIEVKKTKGAEGLKRCFDIIGASSLTAVDRKDYTKLYDLAKGELNAK
jgi:hypothetical protein